MLTERVTVMLSVEQSGRVRGFAARQVTSVSSVIRDAIDTYLDDESVIRREAADRLLSMNAPIDDWDVMKAQIVESRFPELPGWKP